MFLSGNHDFAFAAFLRVLHGSPADFRQGWAEFAASEEREGWFSGEGSDDMQVQGRRWGGKIKVKFNSAKGTDYQGSIYDARPTFESYGAPHGSAGNYVYIYEDILFIYLGFGLLRRYSFRMENENFERQ